MACICVSICVYSHECMYVYVYVMYANSICGCNDITYTDSLHVYTYIMYVYTAYTGCSNHTQTNHKQALCTDAIASTG